MSQHFCCAECGASVRIPYAQSVKSTECRRCGTVYFCNDGKPPRKLYPTLSMWPVDVETGVLSRWMPTHTRPVVPGIYHVRFRETEPTVMVAQWDGASFLAPNGEPVRMAGFLSWRGVLA